MVIAITMKNVVKRGDIYYFRIGVPADCRESVGKREIAQSLKTKEPAEAATLAREWKHRFVEIRNTSPVPPAMGLG